MDDLNEIREGIVQTCLRCVELGYFIGTWGNVSARAGDRLLVTPTRVDYGVMTPEDLVLVDTETGERVGGERLPSSEMQIHRAVYRARPDVGGIVHSHSLYASVVSCMRETIPLVLEDIAQLIGYEVRCAPYVAAQKHMELAEGAVEYLGNSNAVLLANHGPLCCGRDLDEALLANQVLEKSAMAFLWMSALGNGVNVVPPDWAAAEHHRYVYKYGTAADLPE